MQIRYSCKHGKQNYSTIRCANREGDKWSIRNKLIARCHTTCGKKGIAVGSDIGQSNDK